SATQRISASAPNTHKAPSRKVRTTWSDSREAGVMVFWALAILMFGGSSYLQCADFNTYWSAMARQIGAHGEPRQRQGAARMVHSLQRGTLPARDPAPSGRVGP